jgi:hypothetical protein
MKILKSGIEMTPSELSKVRGGGCACGCAPFVNGDALHDGGSEDSACSCICKGTGTSAENIGDYADGFLE